MESFKKPWAGLGVCLALVGGCGQTTRPEEPEAVGTEARALMTFSRPAELVHDINPRPVPGSGSSPGSLTAMGGVLYFAASTSAQGSELWVSDGTEVGTKLVKDINPGTGDANPSTPVPVGGLVYFTANDGSSGHELWRSDGTAAGTFRLKDIRPGSVSSGVLFMQRLGARLFFVADDGTSGNELWVSDGTAAGTRPLTDLKPLREEIGNPKLPVRLGDRLLFVADDGELGLELWSLPPGPPPDTTPPTLVCPSVHEEEATSSSGAVVSAVAVSASDDVTASPVVRYSPALGTVFPLGSSALTVTAEDAAGNTASCGFTVQVRDTTAPLVGCPPDTTVEAEDATGADFAFLLAQPMDAVTRAPAVSVSHAAGSRFPLGTTPVTLSATDEAGNTGACSFTVTVRDSTAPVLVCPADVTVEAGVGEGATVTWPPATASDAVTAALEVTYSQASGSLFPSGTTRVTASTVDGEGQRAECSFQVTVRNATQPPIVIDPIPPPVSEPVGCACSAPGAGGSAPGAVWWLLLGVGMLWSGRRRAAGA